MSVDEADAPELTTMLVGVAEAVSPVGTTDVESATVPVKPFTLANCIDDVPVDPARIVSDGGLVVMLKSTT